MKKFSFLCSIVIVLLLGCGTTKSVPTTIARIPARFDYSPPSRVEAGSTGMTVALISPVFVAKEPEYYVPPFAEMANNMKNDFEELLTAKGFKIRGPFHSRDEMVYNDKMSSDFAFMVEIDLQPTYNRKYIYDPGLGVIVAASYKMKGDITIGGNLVITAASPQYGEKIWKKNIALNKSSFSYLGSIKWESIPTIADELKQDNLFYNLLSRELEKFYTQSMELAWQQIESQEMKTVVAQAKLADKKQ